MFEVTAAMALALMNDKEPEDGVEAIVTDISASVVTNARNGFHDVYLCIAPDEFKYFGAHDKDEMRDIINRACVRFEGNGFRCAVKEWRSDFGRLIEFELSVSW